MSVSITTGRTLAAGVPPLVWEGEEGQFRSQGNIRGCDVTRDGQRLLMVQAEKRPPASVTELVIVQNWFEAFRRLVPAGKW